MRRPRPGAAGHRRLVVWLLLPLAKLNAGGAAVAADTTPRDLRAHPDDTSRAAFDLCTGSLQPGISIRHAGDIVRQ